MPLWDCLACSRMVLLAKAWTTGSEMEACSTDCWLFVHEERKLERTSTGSRIEVGERHDPLFFADLCMALCSLYEVSIVANIGGYWSKKYLGLPFLSCAQLSAFDFCGSGTQDEKFSVNLDRFNFVEKEVRGILFYVQDFLRNPHFTQRFLSHPRIAVLLQSAAKANSITTSTVYVPWTHVETASSTSYGWSACLLGSSCSSPTQRKKHQQAMVRGQWSAAIVKRSSVPFRGQDLNSGASDNRRSDFWSYGAQ